MKIIKEWTSLSDLFGKTYNVFTEEQSTPSTVFSPHLKWRLLGHLNHGSWPLISDLERKLKNPYIHPNSTFKVKETFPIKREIGKFVVVAATVVFTLRMKRSAVRDQHLHYLYTVFSSLALQLQENMAYFKMNCSLIAEHISIMTFIFRDDIHNLATQFTWK